MKKCKDFHKTVIKNYCVLKILRIMKLSTFLLVITVLQVFAMGTYSQNTNLTLDLGETTVKQVLREIEKQSEFYFLFNQKLVDVDRKVNLYVTEKRIDEILSQVFYGTDVDYVVLDRQIVISPREYLAEAKARLQPVVNTGTVTDENGVPLPGVAIIIKGTTQGAITDPDGHYTIEVDDPATAILVFAFVGMKTVEVSVEGKTTIDLIMETETIGLEEVVVIGYGTTKKRDLTGSVASVKGAELENVPVPRLDQQLQGRAAGVQVTQTSGAPGTGSTIRIRGGNSIQGNNEPLYVIDGFIVGTDYNLNSINVNDIESIEILKDAVAISIYGTRGANGVIMVTTKSGKHNRPGQSAVSVNTYYGTQKLKSTIDLADGPQLAYLSNLDAENRGAALPFPDMNNVPNVDWIDQVTQTAPVYNVDLSVSGQTANGKMNYFVSGNHFDQQGIVRNSGIRRNSFRANFDVKLSDKFTFGVRSNISRHRVENNKVDLANLWREGLTARAIYNEDGSFTSRNPVTAGTQRNAEADIQLRVDHQFVSDILLNAYFQYEPVKGLVIRSTIGPNVTAFKRNRYFPGTLPERLETLSGGRAIVNSTWGIDFLNENTIAYSRQLNDNHDFDVLGGFTWQTYQEERYQSEAEGFTNDVTEYNNLGLGDPARNVVTSGYNGFQLVSWLARANYGYKNKYLVTFVGRIDGSSRFSGSNNQYAFFPSVAIAWRMVEEPWIQNLGVFDNLKLRASYGSAGSQAIGSYRTLALLDSYNMFFNGLEQPGVRNGRPASPDLKWETTDQFDVGLEMAFFGGRLAVEMDYYHKTTEDLLLNVSIPTQTGFNTKLQNLGSVQNQGLELMLISRNISKRDFSWSTTLTLSGNRSKVLDIGDAEYIDIAFPTNQGGSGGRLIVGETVPVFVGVKYLGVWNTQEEIDASGIVNQLVGGPRFHDTDGDLVISTNDFEPIGSPEPAFFGGMMNTFTFWDFTLDIFVNGSYGNDLYNSLSHEAYFFREGSNSYVELMDHWTPENMDSDIPMPGTSQSLANIKSNTRLIEDGSYLRLKNIRLGYNLPGKVLNNISWLKGLNVYFSGTNLGLIAQNKLFDPEVSRYASNNNTQIGFTRGEYPYARTLILGLRAEF